MWQYQNTDELYHHGVLGMRWGHRKSRNDNVRYQSVSRRDYNKEYSSLKNKYVRNDPRIKQVNSLAKKAYAYGKKNKLDLDDGGGGSKKSGKKYMSMWKQYDKISDSIYSDAEKRTRKILTSKYGEKRIKQIGRENTALGILAIGGTVAGSIATINLAKHGARLIKKAISKTAKKNL